MPSDLKSLCLPVVCVVARKIGHHLVNPEHLAVTDSSGLKISSWNYPICPNNLYSSSALGFTLASLGSIHFHGPSSLRLVFPVVMIIHSTDPFLPEALPQLHFQGQIPATGGLPPPQTPPQSDLSPTLQLADNSHETRISDALEQKQYCWTKCVTFRGGGFEMQHALTCMHACIANVVFPLLQS